MKISNFKSGMEKVSTVQKKFDKTAKGAMTDGFVEQIKSLAKEDAQKGILPLVAHSKPPLRLPCPVFPQQGSSFFG